MSSEYSETKLVHDGADCLFRDKLAWGDYVYITGFCALLFPKLINGEIEV